jgi:hypothetical protein
MGTLINQIAPFMVVLALAGYCCWSESDDLAATPAKEKSATIELTSTLLAPTSTPAPARNPFPSPTANKKVVTERSITKAPPVKMDLAKNTSHLVLRATFICGDRRLAMINGKFYGEGDTVTPDWRSPEINHTGADKTKPRVVKILSRARNQVAIELFICSLAKSSAGRPRSARRTGGEQPCPWGTGAADPWIWETETCSREVRPLGDDNT